MTDKKATPQPTKKAKATKVKITPIKHTGLVRGKTVLDAKQKAVANKAKTKRQAQQVKQHAANALPKIKSNGRTLPVMKSLVKPAAAEISKQIAELKAMKPDIPPATAFGNDNHAAIDAQIQVLENPAMTESEIYDRWPDEDEDGRDQIDLRDNALSAYKWLNAIDDGAGNESPAQSWRALVGLTIKPIEIEDSGLSF